MAALSAGEIHAILRLKDEMSRKLKDAQRSLMSFGASGVPLFKGVAVAAGVATAAIGAVTGAIVAMGKHGSDVNDVSAAFQDLTRHMGPANQTLDRLSAAFGYTVSNMEIMRSTNLGLSRGLKASASDLELLAKASRLMADRVGGDAVSSYNQLIGAMTRGRVQNIALRDAQVHVTKAINDFAAAQGKSSGELSRAQRILATQQGILAAARAELQRSGEATIDFGDRMKQLTTVVTNTWDAIAGGVARSKSVNSALDAVAKAFQHAFGGSTEKLVITVVTWVNAFAKGVEALAPKIGTLLKSGLQMFWKGLELIWAGAVKAIGGLTMLWGATENIRTQVGNLTTAAYENNLSMDVLKKNYEGVATVIGTAVALLVSLTKHMTLSAGVAVLTTGKFGLLTVGIRIADVAIVMLRESIIRFTQALIGTQAGAAVAGAALSRWGKLVNWGKGLLVAFTMNLALLGARFPIIGKLFYGMIAVFNGALVGLGLAGWIAMIVTLIASIKEAIGAVGKLQEHWAKGGNTIQFLTQRDTERNWVQKGINSIFGSDIGPKPESGEGSDKPAETEWEKAMREAREEAERMMKELTELFNKPLPELDMPEFDEVSEKMAAAMKALKEALAGEFTSLTKEQQEIIDGFEKIGMSAEHIATIMKLPAGAVSKYLSTKEFIKQYNDELRKHMATWEDVGVEIAKTTDRMAEAIMDSAIKTMSVNKEADDFIRGRKLPTLRLELQAIDEVAEADIYAAQLALKAGSISITMYDKQVAAVNRLRDAKRAALIEDDELAQKLLFDALDKDAAQSMKDADKAARASMAGSLGDIASQFADLAEITGGLTGSLKELAEVFATMSLGATAGNQMHTSFEKIGDLMKGGIKKGEVSQLANEYMKLAAAAVAAVGAMQKATDVAGKGKRAARGAATGAQIGGQVAGVYGMIVGAAVGAIWGALRKPAFEQVMKRVGHDWGVTISEELGRAIAETAKKDFGGDLMSAELAHIGDIMKEAGGLDASNIEKFTGKLRDAFVMLDMGKFTVAQTRKVLEDNFDAFADHLLKTGGIASQAFTDIIRLNQEMGVRSQNILDFVSDQAARAGGAILAAFAPLVDMGQTFTAELLEAREGMSDVIDALKPDELKAAREGYQSALTDGFEGSLAEFVAQQYRFYHELEEGDKRLKMFFYGETLDKIAKDPKMFESIEKLEDVQRKIREEAVKAQPEFNRLGVMALGAFNAARAAGLSFNQALEAAGPALDGANDLMEVFGFTAENAAAKTLLIARAVSKSFAGIAAAGLNEAIQALSNFGALNAETMGAIQEQLATTFSRVQAEVAAQGGTHEDALIQVLPALENILKAHQELGLPIDENTQMLIDQAAELGLLGKGGKTSTDILVAGFESMVTAIGSVTGAIRELITTMGGIPSALPDFPGVPGGGGGPGDGGPAGDGTGFSSGTKAFGSWYRKFDPRGEWTKLHGMEAVIPKSQEMEFAMDVLMRSGALPDVMSGRSVGEVPDVMTPGHASGRGESGGGSHSQTMFAPIVVNRDTDIETAIDEMFKRLPRAMAGDRHGMRVAIRKLIRGS